MEPDSHDVPEDQATPDDHKRQAKLRESLEERESLLREKSVNADVREAQRIMRFK
ncbi:hypothetical protein JOF42_002433 [Microbacterium phyllosphaerae]|uniref:Uncharacterized protein n=1 Tax=Microbacterium phyllosphaerae TaxID=124798 RepID=A0ABS4WSK8_9MICO|nr:hypothetical protein [Microbacterium phyllosphaerae]